MGSWVQTWSRGYWKWFSQSTAFHVNDPRKNRKICDLIIRDRRLKIREIGETGGIHKNEYRTWFWTNWKFLRFLRDRFTVIFQSQKNNPNSGNEQDHLLQRKQEQFSGEQGDGIYFLGFKGCHHAELSRQGKKSKLSLLLHPFTPFAWKNQEETFRHSEKKFCSIKTTRVITHPHNWLLKFIIVTLNCCLTQLTILIWSRKTFSFSRI